MIEHLQPYHGCSWTKFIRDFSNPDKHKTLTAVKHPIAINLDSNDTTLADNEAGVENYVSIKVAFSNGTPVIEGLEQLIFDVSQAIHVFDFEFL
jgi:hypothetical protein